MARCIFFNFDGTGNEPADAIVDRNLLGKQADTSISNILKFHLLLGGNLHSEQPAQLADDDLASFYYQGIGTYGGFLQRAINSGLAPESRDVRHILRSARADFERHYDREKFDYVVITGFSRGGALARRFASLINDQVAPGTIIEGIFDTVASVGIPNLNNDDRPDSEVIFEEGHQLPSNVIKALHLVALDEKRRAFQPTLMNRDNRVLEVWFPGAHSDIGGGYNFDGLSDSALRFFLDWFEELNIGIQFKTARELDYDSIFDPGSRAYIGQDDVQIDPNPLGVNHQQERTALLSTATLGDRRCCVVEYDRIIRSALPLVHWTVAERIRADRNYRPESLRNLKHRLLYADGNELEFTGMAEHKLMSLANLNPPTPQGEVTRAYAHRKYNHTGLMLEKGRRYLIEAVNLAKHKWRDGSIQPVDGDGWNRGDVQLGFRTEAAILVAEPFRRVTDRHQHSRQPAQWFSLCGCINRDDSNAFLINNQLEGYVATETGELCLFANDLNGYYGNNSGFLEVRVRKLD